MWLPVLLHLVPTIWCVTATTPLPHSKCKIEGCFHSFPCPPCPFSLPRSKHKMEGVPQLSVATAMKTSPNNMILAVVWAYSVCFFLNYLFFTTNNYILHLFLPCQEPPSPHPSLSQNTRQRSVSTLSLAHYTPSPSLARNMRQRGFSNSQLWQQ